jgi:hypothetical protein
MKAARHGPNDYSSHVYLLLMHLTCIQTEESTCKEREEEFSQCIVNDVCMTMDACFVLSKDTADGDDVYDTPLASTVLQ